MNERLYKSRTDVVVSGVAGGVADWLRMDPSLVRIVWVVLTPLTGGLALLVYIVMWIVVPVDPRDPSAAAPAAPPVPGSAPGGEAPTVEAPPAGEATTATTPAVPSPPPPLPAPRREPGNAGMIVGLGLIVLGGLFLAREFFPPFRWDYIWPVGLILLGALLIFGVGRRS
jgi:phage shock protein C